MMMLIWFNKKSDSIFSIACSLQSSQIIARYNAERFSNRLSRVGRLNNFRTPIAEGYFPKLDSLVASRSWPGEIMMRLKVNRCIDINCLIQTARVSGAVLKDLNRELDQVRLDITDLERWRERFVDAVNQGSVVDTSGNRITLDERRGEKSKSLCKFELIELKISLGIDILGNMMEASILTPNANLYGDLHNMVRHNFNTLRCVHRSFWHCVNETF